MFSIYNTGQTIPGSEETGQSWQVWHEEYDELFLSKIIKPVICPFTTRSSHCYLAWLSSYYLYSLCYKIRTCCNREEGNGITHGTSCYEQLKVYNLISHLYLGLSRCSDAGTMCNSITCEQYLFPQNHLAAVFKKQNICTNVLSR